MTSRLPRPKKRFGQHFLTDRHYLARIAAAIDAKRGDHMVEIGPGTGILTAELAPRVERLHVVEIDRDLGAALEGRFPNVAVHVASAPIFLRVVRSIRL